MERDLVVVEVKSLPKCDVCKTADAQYDAKLKQGPWAYLCSPCWLKHSVGRLGTGLGQRLKEGTMTEQQKQAAQIKARMAKLEAATFEVTKLESRLAHSVIGFLDVIDDGLIATNRGLSAEAQMDTLRKMVDSFRAKIAAARAEMRALTDEPDKYRPVGG